MECDEEKMRNGEDVWFAKCGGGAAEDIGEEEAKKWLMHDCAGAGWERIWEGRGSERRRNGLRVVPASDNGVKQGDPE